MKFQISESWVRDYKDALGYSEELRQDPGFVPPLFAACLRDPQFFAFEALGIQLSQLLHASQRYEFFEDIQVGDTIDAGAEITSLRRKEGKAGCMVFLEITSEYFRSFGTERRIAVKASMTVVVRAANEA